MFLSIRTVFRIPRVGWKKSLPVLFLASAFLSVLFAAHGDYVRPYTDAKTVVFTMLFAMMVAVGLFRLFAKRRRPQFSAAALLAFLFFLSGIAVQLLSVEHGASDSDVTLWWGALFACLAGGMFGGRAVTYAIFLTAGVGVLTQGTLMAFQHFGHDPFVLRMGLNSQENQSAYTIMLGTVGNPNGLAQALAVLLAASLSLSIIVTRSGWRVWGLGATVAGLLAILTIATGSRGAMLALPVIIAVTVSLKLLPVGAKRWRVGLVLGVACLPIVTAVLPFFVPAANNPQAPQTTVRYRIEIWRTCWRSFADNPLTGSGIGVFETSLLRYPSLALALQQSSETGSEVVNRAHHDLLDVAVERGALGVVVYMGAIVSACVVAVRRPRSRASCALVSVVLAVAVMGSADFPLMNAVVAVLFWSAFGALAMRWQPIENRVRHSFALSIVGSAMGYLVVFGTWQAVRFHRESVTVARVLAMRPDDPQASQKINDAQGRYPRNRMVLEAAYRHAEAKREVATMNLAAKEWCNAAPGLSAASMALGTAQAVSGNVSGAIALYKQAVAESPTNIAAMLNLAQAYASVKDYPNARATFQQAQAISRKAIPKEMIQFMATIP